MYLSLMESILGFIISHDIYRQKQAGQNSRKDDGAPRKVTGYLFTAQLYIGKLCSSSVTLNELSILSLSCFPPGDPVQTKLGRS